MKKFIVNLQKIIENSFKATDLILIFLTTGASAFSFILIFSLYPQSISTLRPVIIQSVVSVFGFSLAILISNIDYHKIAKFWKPIAIATFLFNLVPFSPIGRARTDNLNWIDLGFTKLQPSEFLKIVFIITFAFHCSMVLNRINEPTTFIQLIAHAMAPTLIIFLQKDYGTMIIFVCIAGAILFVAGINWKIITGSLIMIGIALIMFCTNTLPEFLRMRFAVLADLEKHKDGAGWQQFRGALALASGKIFGNGFFNDDLLDVPEIYNDMIFTHIGQTLGFVGCVVTLIWLCCLCFRIIHHGKHAQDNLGYLICIGCFTLIFCQATINLGMALCLTPVIGVPLPFISAGGSTILSSYLLIGLVLSVQKNSFKSTLFQ